MKKIFKSILNKNFNPILYNIVSDKKFIDSKSLFQEKAQEFDGVTPSYKTIRTSGPDHEKKFTVGVYVGKELVAEGEGKSKQDAEQEAAMKALKNRSWE